MTHSKKSITPRLFWYYTAGIILVWTFFICLSVLWHKKTVRSGSLEAARIEAREIFQNHVIYRSWNAMHGGVYAKVTPRTQPNIYLKVAERDIQTPSGIQLTKINPAFMTRQINELAFEKFGIISHITSLKPIRPQNKPDAWEKKSLELFEQGSGENSSIATINNSEYLRLMRPLITEQGCLACHADQGYKKGDIRGGISVAVPLAKHIAISNSNMKNHALMYGFLWLIGLAGTFFFMYILNRQIQKRLKAEKELIQQEKLEGVVEMARAVCHELNQPLQMILGNSEIILMEGTDPEAILKRVKLIQKQVGRMGELSRKLIKIASYETKQMPQGKVIDIDKSSGHD